MVESSESDFCYFQTSSIVCAAYSFLIIIRFYFPKYIHFIFIIFHLYIHTCMYVCMYVCACMAWIHLLFYHACMKTDFHLGNNNPCLE